MNNMREGTFCDLIMGFLMGWLFGVFAVCCLFNRRYQTKKFRNGVYIGFGMRILISIEVNNEEFNNKQNNLNHNKHSTNSTQSNLDNDSLNVTSMDSSLNEDNLEDPEYEVNEQTGKNGPF